MGDTGQVRGDDFIVPIDRELPTVSSDQWTDPEAAAEQLGISMGRLRLLANADTVRVVRNGDGDQGLLTSSVEHEVDRRARAGWPRRALIAVSDVARVNIPQRRSRRPWEAE